LFKRLKLGALIVEKCKVMNSKKASLSLVFECEGTRDSTFTLLFKVGDDLRQEMFALDAMRWMNLLWRREGLDLHVTTYNCVATGRNCGLIEVVTRATTTARIISNSGGAFAALRATPLFQWFQSNSVQTRTPIDHIVARFTRSCAACCVATYVLGVGDRHNDNVVVRPNGELFHVDFGHILGHIKRQFGVMRVTAPFVLTRDFERVIVGGAQTDDQRGVAWSAFVALGESAFGVLRRHVNVFVALLATTTSAGLKSLTDVNYVLSALSDESVWSDLVARSLASKRSVINNVFHIVRRHGVFPSTPIAPLSKRNVSSGDISLYGPQFQDALDNRVLTVNAISALLTQASTTHQQRLTLLNLRQWNVACSRALRVTLSEGNVVWLDLTRTPLSSGAVLSALLPLSCTSLRALNLSHCAAGDTIVDALFGVASQLEELSLVDNRLTTRCVPALCELLTCGSKTLRLLNVEQNTFPSGVVNVLVNCALRKLRSLSRLAVDERINAKVQERVERRMSLHQSNDALVTVDDGILDLSYNALIRSATANYIVVAMSVDWSSIRVLVLEHLMISDSTTLTDTLARCPTLESLSLDHNRLETLSTAFMAAVASTTQLTQLSVASNRLTSWPMAAVDERPLRLHTLDLSNNRIYSLPLFAFDNLSLQVLDLSSNAFESWPLALNVESLAHCRELLLARNSLSTVPSLMLGSLTSLQYLSFRGNPFLHISLDSSDELLRSMRLLYNTRPRPYAIRVVFLGAERVGKSSYVCLGCI
jgi:hypothetical protein